MCDHGEDSKNNATELQVKVAERFCVKHTNYHTEEIKKKLDNTRSSKKESIQGKYLRGVIF